MNWSWKIGRVAGIELYLHPTFLLLLGLVGLSEGGMLSVLLTAAAFGCVLLHELGHAMAARVCGIATVDITLYPIGGVARLARMPRKPASELLITLAGPAVNVALAAVLWSVVAVGGLVGVSSPFTAFGLRFLSSLAFINLILAAFNMVPAFPMDGGRVLRALLSGWIGRLRATEFTARLGKLLAIGFGFWSLLNGNLLQVALAVFVYLAASAELFRVRREEGDRWDDDDRDRGIRVGPDGKQWVRVGQGLWQLAPITVGSGRGRI